MCVKAGKSGASISIHAPLRERPLTMEEIRDLHDFNPRSLAGATVWATAVQLSPCHFNPRSLAGATVIQAILERSQKYFNPRSLTGATCWRFAFTQILSISIHAPSRERQTHNLCCVLHHYFNPRSLTGATLLCRQHKLVALDISIHAPSRERLNSAGSVNPAAAFQSTLSRGSDWLRCRRELTARNFNPRSLAEATL